MNLSELRTTLDAHADFHDTELASRSTEVHARVRAARRRRGAAFAAGAAAVVAVVAAGVLLPMQRAEGPEVADRRFGDLTAPGTMDALGYTYSFDRLITGKENVVLSEQEADVPLLITWANTGEGDYEYRAMHGAEWHPTNGDFTDYVVIEEGGEPALEVRGRGELAVAVYQLSELAPGPASGDLHFPAQSGMRELDATAFGTAGQTEVEVEFTVPEGPWELIQSCSGAPEEAWVALDVGGTLTTWSGDCSKVGTAGEPGGIRFPDGVTDATGRVLQPGDRTSARLWLSEDADATRPFGSAPEVQLGLAVYRLSSKGNLAGHPVGYEIDRDGHTWSSVGLEKHQSRHLEKTLRASVDGSRPLLLLVGSRDSRRDRKQTLKVWIDGKEREWISAPGGGALATLVLDPGHHSVEVEVVKGAPTELGIAVYERVD